MTISELEEKLTRLDLAEIVRKAIQETAPEYEELNESQWREGQENDGQDIHPEPYSAPYAKVRQKEGLQTAYIDLYRTGSFYQGYTLEANQDTIDMSSAVEYEKYLTKRYGQEIWGLSPESIEKYREVLRPVLIEMINQELYG